MKKYHIAVAAILCAGASITFSSCIGSFALTKKVIAWNNQVGNKFVNELVFIAFWILPVYEVTAVADLIVLNSIEFWSGSNPMSASVKYIDTDHGRYLIKCDGRGYDVICQTTGEKTRLDFNFESQTWSVVTENGQEIPFMTFIDDSHVKMITKDGDFRSYDLSNTGVMAYSNDCEAPMMAAN